MNLHSIRALQAVCSSELQLGWREPPLPPQHQTPPEHSVKPACCNEKHVDVRGQLAVLLGQPYSSYAPWGGQD